MSQDDAKQRWLQSTAVLGLLHRLTLQEPAPSERPAATSAAAESDAVSHSQQVALGMQRQTARIIAMISADANSQAGIR